MPVSIPFNQEIEFEYGHLEQVSPLIRRIVCNNPGAFTFKGSGTYVVGRGNVAVIDPGPLDDAHISALTKALDGETVTHILITHTHMDHSPGAKPLKAKTGAKTYGYGPHGAGKRLEGVAIEEGGDMDFVPDIAVRHGDLIEGDGWTFECVYTPGHTSNHICFALKEEKALFSGDHVMGWSTSVIGPPDGDMAAYMKSLELLLTRSDEIYWPTHGSPIKDPKPFVQAFIDHRLDREKQILKAVSDGHHEISEMVEIMYVNVDKRLYPAASMSVLAHIIRMVGDGRLACDEVTPTLRSTYLLP